MGQKSILISVIISSYNAGDYIIDALESIRSQSWPEIELIITDDCSEDNTLALSRNWLLFNKNRFFNSIIISSERNTGVAANANRGLRAANGEWVKFLGADDALKPNCLKDNMAFIGASPNAKIVFSKIEVYRDTFTEENIVKVIPGDPFSSKSIFAKDRDANSQYKMLLTNDRIHFSPSAFVNGELLKNIGGFEEDYKNLEDYPLWLKLTRLGYQLYFMNSITVSYRMHGMALNNKPNEFVIKPSYFLGEKFRRKHVYPYLPLLIRFNLQYLWLVSQIFRNDKVNTNKSSSKALYNILTDYLNPFRYLIFFQKLMSAKHVDNEYYT